jgi:hypothetical protein
MLEPLFEEDTARELDANSLRGGAGPERGRGGGVGGRTRDAAEKLVGERAVDADAEGQPLAGV